MSFLKKSKEISVMSRVYNFSAGPAVLPEEVLKEAAEEMLDYRGCGMSVMEMSHRSKMFDNIIKEAEADLRKLPKAGFGYRDRIMGVRASEYPLGVHYTPILDFLNHPLIPLSQKATIGFLNRTRQSTNVVYPEYFTNSILQYLRNQYGYEE